MIDIMLQNAISSTFVFNYSKEIQDIVSRYIHNNK